MCLPFGRCKPAVGAKQQINTVLRLSKCVSFTLSSKSDATVVISSCMYTRPGCGTNCDGTFDSNMRWWTTWIGLLALCNFVVAFRVWTISTVLLLGKLAPLYKEKVTPEVIWICTWLWRHAYDIIAYVRTRINHVGGLISLDTYTSN